MTFATLTNVVLILLCGAVLVQSVRMMRSFETMKKGGLKEVVEALDRSTAQARHVLGDLKETLRTEGAANARNVARGEEMREELTMMVGIANAVAERIVETVEAAKTLQRAQVEDEDAAPTDPSDPADPPAMLDAPAPKPRRRAAAKPSARGKKPAARTTKSAAGAL
jgi:hypothetical protein